MLSVLYQTQTANTCLDSSLCKVRTHGRSTRLVREAAAWWVGDTAVDARQR